MPVWAAGDYVERIRWLSYAILFAGFLHVAVEVPPLLKIGFRFQWIWDAGCERLKKVWHLLLPVPSVLLATRLWGRVNILPMMFHTRLDLYGRTSPWLPFRQYKRFRAAKQCCI